MVERCQRKSRLRLPLRPFTDRPTTFNLLAFLPLAIRPDPKVRIIGWSVRGIPLS